MSIAKRITLNLNKRAAAHFDALMERTGLNQTEVVSRALAFYATYEEDRAAGVEHLRRRPDKEELEVIVIL